MRQQASAAPFAHSYAVVIGIDQYINGVPPLHNAASDARRMAEILGQAPHSYIVQSCIDQQATLSILVHSFEELKAQVGPEDRLLIYFAGHGVARESDDRPTGYLIPQDAHNTDLSTWLPMSTLHRALEGLPCRHMLLILDCCFAGSFRWSATRGDLPVAPHTLYRERYERYIRDPAWQVLTSAAANQRALDVLTNESASDLLSNFGARASGGKHSPFAQALFDGLSGEADLALRQGALQGDGVITATELYLYLRDRLDPPATDQPHQTPGLYALFPQSSGEFVFQLNSFVDLPPTPSNNPYLGLAPFDQAHADLFFGRETLITLLSMLVCAPTHAQTARTAKKDLSALVVVIGASGVGKTSLISAGLLPQLQHDPVWQISPPVRPSVDLTSALAAWPQPANGASTLALRIASELARDPNQKLLLFIDQAEEFMTVCGPQERMAALQELADAATAYPEQLRIVLAVRADFATQLLAEGPLADHWLHARRLIVPPMAQDSLRQAIIGPAITHALLFEPDELVDRMINDVLGMPGQLPLLSFTLSKLYDKLVARGGEDQTLREDDYDALQGVVGALPTYADAQFHALDAAHQATMQRVLLRMVALDGGTLARRRVSPAELDYPDDTENERVDTICKQLVNARLIIADAGYIELAHDALLRSWTRFQGWLRDAQESLILRGWLTHPAALWEQNGRDATWLWTNDPRLPQADAARLAQPSWLNRREQAFVAASAAANTAAQQQKIAPVLAAQATYVQSQLKQDELGALLACQAYHFNQRGQGTALDQVDNALRSVLGTPFFSVTLQAHSDRVWTAAFSPDSHLLATGGLDGTVRLWDLRQPGRTPTTIQCHELWVTCLAFSSQGQLLATASDDCSIRIWDLRQPNSPPTILQHDRRVWALAFSPDGQMLASGGEEARIRLWDVAQPLTQPHSLSGFNRAMWALAFSPDGQALAAGGDDQIIRVWNVRQPQAPPQLLAGHTDTVRALAFHPDSTTIASGSHDYTIRVWQHYRQNAPPIVIRNHRDLVRSVAFSPDGRTLASGSDDHSVRLWDVGQFAQQSIQLVGHTSAVSAVVFSPDGATLASASDDYSVRLWDRRPPVAEPVVLKQADAATSAVFSPDGRTLAVGGFGTEGRSYAVQLWNLAQLDQQPITLSGAQSGIWSVAWSPDGQILGAASYDGLIRLWDTRTPEGEPITLDRPAGIVLVFSPDGTLLASAGEQTVRLRNMRQLAAAPTILHQHADWVGALAFSPDGRTLASGSHDTTICLWDVHDVVTAPVILRGHRDKIWCLAFSPDGRTLASSGDDKTVRLWNIGQPESASLILSGHEAKVKAVAFSPDGHTLVSGGDDQTVRLWNMDRLGDLPRVLHVNLPGTTDGISSLTFSPDGQTLAIGSTNGTIHLWIAQTAQLANLACAQIRRNLTREEWRRFVDTNLPYETTCPNLPADPVHDDPPRTSTQVQTLRAPIQRSPADGMAFYHSPRTLTLRWTTVAGAQSYTVQVEFDGSVQAQQPVWRSWQLIPQLTTTSYTHDFIGSQPGRWRVWAVDATGQASPKSDWWTFEFTALRKEIS